MAIKLCKTCRRKTSSKYDNCSYCYSKNNSLKTIEGVFRDTFSNKNKRYKRTWEELPNINNVGYEVN